MPGPVTVVLGAQWGDEGKGKLVDVLAAESDVVARCQGGNNAGHSVHVEDIAYDFHMLPSGIIWPNCTSLLGNGVVIHLPNFFDEIAKNEAKGLTDWQRRLKISDKAHLVFDLHQTLDGMEEMERSNNGTVGKLGTTRKGIGPTYACKVARSGIRVGDLVAPDFDKSFAPKFRELCQSVMNRHRQVTVDVETELARYAKFAIQIRPCVVESVTYLHGLISQRPDAIKVLVEGANAAMLDIDFGTYPFVTSSNCSIGAVSTGLGLPPRLIGQVFGVIKAYTTRVGGGPFPTGQDNKWGDYLQKTGAEFGVTTGRPRRCGWLDLPMVKYTALFNDYTALAMTKLDILDDLDEIPVGVAYVRGGQHFDGSDWYPSNSQDYDGLEVKYVTLSGWKQSSKEARAFVDLPKVAQDYVSFVEQSVGIPIRWIGVGQKRSAIIDRGEQHVANFVSVRSSQL